VVPLIVRRLVQLPLILAVVFALTLLLAWTIPGNPLERPDGRRPNPEVVKAIEAQYNLDDFGTFARSYLASASGARWALAKLAGERPTGPVFDLGPSLQYRDWRVSEIVADALPVSVTLGAGAIIIALALGLFAGVVGAVKPNSVADLFTLAVALVGISLPNFVIGTALLLVFTVELGWFPIATWGVHGAVLPMVTLSLPFAAYIARLTRMGMIETLGADFIRTARAKGAPERRVLLNHALKNAFLPVLSYLGPAAALAMTGSFVVERVFTVPGMGQHFVNAVLNKDLFLILGVVMVYATMLIVFNLVVDVLYRWVDPRIV
jgi:oligopeptide transport system permease protein